jgi:uncharacterized protein
MGGPPDLSSVRASVRRMTGPAAARLLDGRLHFQHGPIDLILEAFGPQEERAAAYAQAWAAFRPVLDDLVAVLPLLRTPVTQLVGEPSILREPTVVTARAPVGWGSTPSCAPGAVATPVQAPAAPPGAAGPLPPRGVEEAVDSETMKLGGGPAPMPYGRRPIFAPGSIAAAMLRATAPHAPVFVTPMAAVAGAVADHVLAAMTAGRRLSRAYVNNGGDAALWLTPGTEIVAAGGPGFSARITVRHEAPVRGIATSGWRGRSHSLGIADAVTVLARTAADADAAATLVANAVDLPGHPAIRRRPARELSPDSDLGDLPVTVAVGPLAPEEVAQALAAGREAAEAMRRRGLIAGAALWLDNQVETVGTALPTPAATGA